MLLSPDQAKLLVNYCIEERFALLAANADSPAAIYDCLKAAKDLDAPIIIETSLWQLEGISFGAGDPHRGLAIYYAHINLLANSKEFEQTPVLLHTDHIRGPVTRDLLVKAVQGFPMIVEDQTVRLSPSTISLDAASLSPEENIELICSLIETAEECGRPLTLEMEAGLDSGLTTAEEAEILVMGVEKRYPGYLALFAPGLGNRHGFCRDGYPGFSPEHVKRHAALIEDLTGRKIGIVLHGASGLAPEQIKQAVANGLTKMNWSTDGLILRSSSGGEFYDSQREQLTPGHADFKNMAMDNGVGRYVSEKFVPAIKRLITLLNGNMKAKQFMANL